MQSDFLLVWNDENGPNKENVVVSATHNLLMSNFEQFLHPNLPLSVKNSFQKNQIFCEFSIETEAYFVFPSVSSQFIELFISHEETNFSEMQSMTPLWMESKFTSSTVQNCCRSGNSDKFQHWSLGVIEYMHWRWSAANGTFKYVIIFKSTKLWISNCKYIKQPRTGMTR